MIADNLQAEAGVEIRCINPQEVNDVADIEECYALPKVPCDRERILKTVRLVHEMTLVAVETATGRVVGFVQGFPTYEKAFRKEFYKDSAFYNPNGDTLVIMAINVIPGYRGAGIEKQLVYTLCINEFQHGRKRAVILCHPMKVHMFERLRFKDLGKTDIRRGGKIWHEMHLSMEKWGAMRCDACGNTSPMTLFDNGYDYCCELCGNRTDNETGKLHPVLCEAADDINLCKWPWDWDDTLGQWPWTFDDFDSRYYSGGPFKKVNHHKKEKNPQKIVLKYRQKKKEKLIRKRKRRQK